MSPPLVTRQVINLLVVHFIGWLSLETKPRPRSWPTLSIVWHQLKKSDKLKPRAIRKTKYHGNPRANIFINIYVNELLYEKFNKRNIMLTNGIVSYPLFENSWLSVREFITNFLIRENSQRKIRWAIFGAMGPFDLTGCSGAVPWLINMSNQIY